MTVSSSPSPIPAAPQAELKPWIDERGRHMERLELHITYTCPERCGFCSEAHRMARYNPWRVTWGRIAKVLRTQAARGVTSVHFTGGEPTIHPRFVDACKLAKKLGMRTSVGTIGTMLSREDSAREMLPWLDEILFSLHGPDAATHDAETRNAGSFERVTRAMRLASELGPARLKARGLYVNSVVTRQNVTALPDTIALAAGLGAKLAVISNLTPEGGALDEYAELVAPLEELARVLPQVPARAPGVMLRFFGVPMCLLGSHYLLSNDLHWDARVTVEWQTRPGKIVFDGIYNWAPDRKRAHAAPCQGCGLRDICAGVFEEYAARYPLDALRPVQEPAELRGSRRDARRYQ